MVTAECRYAGDISAAGKVRRPVPKRDAFGWPSNAKMCGFPYFKNVEFNGEFPIVAFGF